MTRLASGLLVTALLRRVNDSGGFGAVLARGDPDSGAILLVTSDRDRDVQCYERGWDEKGNDVLVATGPAGDPDASDYWQRRRSRDSDLWVVALDSAEAKRFAAETIIGG